MKKHFKLLIKGKVQGVYYRASAKQMADLLGIEGLVQNTPEGHVYAEAEGEEEGLIKFVQWCHHGPDRAQVEAVSVTDGPVQGYKGFTIKR